jgi:hypothetical protein
MYVFTAISFKYFKLIIFQAGIYGRLRQPFLPAGRGGLTPIYFASMI